MKIASAALAIAIALAGSGCFGPDESREDARDTKNVDKRPPEVIAFNNHYPNVETKCNHGHRLYVVTQGNYRFQVVPNDSTCGARR